MNPEQIVETYKAAFEAAMAGTMQNKVEHHAEAVLAAHALASAELFKAMRAAA